MGSDRALVEQQAQSAGGLSRIAAPVHQVTVAAEGTVFACPADKKIIDAAHAANVLVPYSCRAGQCGTCKGRLLRGRVEYADGLPDAIDSREAEGGYVLFCSAYARSDLTIELPRAGFE